MVVLSCNRNEEKLQDKPMEGVPNYSVGDLDSVLHELRVDSVVTFDAPEFMQPYYVESISEEGLIVTNDRSENNIHLFDEMGNHLYTAGGQGRGPGEFTNTVKLHAGWDNDIYVLETFQYRISQFRVSREGFSYVTTHSISLESSGTWLLNIYVTEWGNFGVSRSILDYKTGEDQFQFYKLDDSFNQDELLITMPGNEKMALGEFQNIDHIIGAKTYWDLDDEWFYYITSQSPVINKYNLRTGESTTVTYFNLEEREIIGETRDYVMEYASNWIERFPAVEDEVEEATVLPLFRELMVQDGILYLVMLDVTGSEQTEIIRTNTKTEKSHYLKIPSKLFRIKASSGMVYGIKTSGVTPSVQFVKLAQ